MLHSAQGIVHPGTCVIANQAGLFVAGAWGILMFGELRGHEQVGYWISSVVLIAGCTMLAVSK